MTKKTKRHDNRVSSNTNTFKKNMSNKKGKLPVAKKDPSNAKHSSFNEDRRSAEAAAGKVYRGKGKKPLTAAEQGEKLYACMVEDCEEIFDTWREATRHMRDTCKCGRLPQGTKPHIKDSREKANGLLREGRVQAKTAKTYPVPTDEAEIADTIRAFYRVRGTGIAEANRQPRKEQQLLKLDIIKHWGPGNFSRFGFGDLVEFCERHGISISTDTL
jgi:hypothetical protein